MPDNNPSQSPKSITWALRFGVNKNNETEIVYTKEKVFPGMDRMNRPPTRPQNRRDDYYLSGVPQSERLKHNLVGPGSATINGESVTLDHIGYETCQILDVPTDGKTTTNQTFGEKENLRIEAKIRTAVNCTRNLKHQIDYPVKIPFYKAGAYREVPLTLSEDLFNSFPILNPILYIEQPKGGFLLFAEMEGLINGDKMCRMIFASMQHIPADHRPLLAEEFFVDAQLLVCSAAYEIDDEYRTLEVFQNGDHGSTAIYLEFEVVYSNDIRKSLGVCSLKNPEFQFIAEKESRIGIGYWPRTDQEALYFHGDIESVVCDPHGLCPCSG